MSSDETINDSLNQHSGERPKAAAGGEQPEEMTGTDPGLKYLGDIKLTPEEEAEYTRLAKENMEGVLGFEAGTKEDGWKHVTNMFGVQVSSKPSLVDSSRMMCKGRAVLPPATTLELVQEQFVKAYNNNKALPQQMRYSDPMSRETKILCQIPCGEKEFTRIVWGSFAAVGVAYARDFCFLQHACPATDPKSGAQLYIVSACSVERAEVPDMEKLCRRIRSTVMTSGYVFREHPEGGIDATYVVNFNPNGWIPTKIVNTVAISQALNVSRVVRRLEETITALAAMKIPAPVFSTDVAWRGSFTEKIPRPAKGSAPVTASVKFWSTGRLLFCIKGAHSTSVTAWEPAEAASLFSDGSWATYNRHEAESVNFKVLPVEDDETAPEKAALVLEWKAGGWFKGLSVYHKVELL